MTAATFVGLMSIPGLAVLYGGVMQKRWSVNSMMLTFIGFAVVHGRVGAVGVQDGVRQPDPPVRRGRQVVLLEHGREPAEHPRPRRVAASGCDPAARRVDTAAALPRGVALLFPVRVRGDHAAADAGQRARTDQLQGVDPVRGAVDHLRLRDQRVPHLGRRLLRRPRRTGLLRWLRHPPLGRRLRLRRGLGHRPAAASATARSTHRTTC